MTCVDGWICDLGDCIFDDPCESVTCEGRSLCEPERAQCRTFFCDNDRYDLEGENNNNELEATPLEVKTQRIDQLSICTLDIDWYSFTLPPNTSVRLGALYEAHVGRLMMRLYSDQDLFNPEIESNTELDSEWIAINESPDEMRYYIRVSSANGQFNRNRYTLTMELNLPGELCNDDSDCQGNSCINSLCGGVGAENPAPYPNGGMSSMDSDPSLEPIEPTPCTADRYEPNNQLDQASSLSTRGIRDARICSGDIDYYRFTLTRRSDVTVRVLFDQNEGDLDAVITDGNNVYSSGISPSNDEILEIEEAPAGDYYLMVSGVGNQTENDYTITMSIRARP